MSNLARPPVITSDVEDLCDIMAHQLASRHHNVLSWYRLCVISTMDPKSSFIVLSYLIILITGKETHTDKIRRFSVSKQT